MHLPGLTCQNNFKLFSQGKQYGTVKVLNMSANKYISNSTKTIRMVVQASVTTLPEINKDYLQKFRRQPTVSLP